jgi:hypothetical protein
MLRLLFLLAFAVAPLVAAAHGGHHAQEQGAQIESQVAPAITVLVAAPCPGGNHEVCSCHALSCVSPAEHPVVADVPARGVVFSAPATGIARDVCALLPAAPPVSFRPRGPPQRS